MKTIKNAILITLCILSISAQAQNKAFEVKVKGNGEPILLFPGFTCTGEVWDNLVSELSKTKECHIFTFAGFGDVPPIQKPWFPKVKEGVEQYISTNKLEKATIIGHSLGGSLALWLATTNHNFNKVIVVDALPSVGALMMPNFNKENIVYNNPYSNQLLTMDEEDFEKVANQFAEGMSLNKDFHSQIKEWILKSDRETYVHGYTDLLKLDLREDIANIKVPVTILGATHPFGLETAKKTFDEQYKSLKNYKIKFAENSAHFIMYDKPEWFLKTVLSELE